MFSISTSTGGSFNFPQTLADVTLGQYIDFMSFVEPTKPAELIRIETASSEKNDAETEDEIQKAWTEFEEAIQACDDIVMYRKVYPYFARVVAHFAKGITEAEIVGGKKQGDGMNIGNLEYLYTSIVKMLNSYDEPEYTNVILVDGDLWYLPMQYMEKSTLIEYAEASQFEANLKSVENGNYKALAKIMCVLVRKEGEMYSDKLMKREEMFLSWTLENCLKVAFFLLKRNETSQQNMLIYTAAQDLMNVRRESKN